MDAFAGFATTRSRRSYTYRRRVIARAIVACHWMEWNEIPSHKHIQEKSRGDGRTGWCVENSNPPIYAPFCVSHFTVTFVMWEGIFVAVLWRRKLSDNRVASKLPKLAKLQENFRIENLKGLIRLTTLNNFLNGLSLRLFYLKRESFLFVMYC